jgi:hypothetical protein
LLSSTLLSIIICIRFGAMTMYRCVLYDADDLVNTYECICLIIEVNFYQRTVEFHLQFIPFANDEVRHSGGNQIMNCMYVTFRVLQLVNTASVHGL